MSKRTGFYAEPICHADGSIDIAVRSPEGDVVCTTLDLTEKGAIAAITEAFDKAKQIAFALNSQASTSGSTNRQEEAKAARPSGDLAAPWSLHFDRDGTEEYGIICDAEGKDLVASHLPTTKLPRWANRDFGEGCFWLPEQEGDEMPVLVSQMRLMAAAPELLQACEGLLELIQEHLPNSSAQVHDAIAAISKARVEN